jgi:hypothetical protein
MYDQNIKQCAYDQAQASEQFLASIKLASNKAIGLKTKK